MAHAVFSQTNTGFTIDRKACILPSSFGDACGERLRNEIVRWGAEMVKNVARCLNARELSTSLLRPTDLAAATAASKASTTISDREGYYK